jgi:hypothetical protein
VAPCGRITRYMPNATLVALVSDTAAARKLVGMDVFEVVLETDPSWRLLSALRNAIERSVYRDFLCCG